LAYQLSRIFLVLAILAESPSAIGQTVACITYLRNYDDNARLSFSYGYFEGVEAALTKDILDVLVTPTDPDHPVWWVLPAGVTSYSAFVERLTSACKKQPTSDMTKTALSIASRQDGWPKVGIWIDKKTGELSREHEKWKRFMGDARVLCKDYIESAQTTRDALVSGYFAGTEAYRIAMKYPADDRWVAWPLGVEVSNIRSELDESCKKPKNTDGTIRDVLWVLTFELWAKSQGSSPKN
jgi:hypothetical protein